MGVKFAASPRHVDVLLVTGPVSRNLEVALKRTYDAIRNPSGWSPWATAAALAGCSARATRHAERFPASSRSTSKCRVARPRLPPYCRGFLPPSARTRKARHPIDPARVKHEYVRPDREPVERSKGCASTGSARTNSRINLAGSIGETIACRAQLADTKVRRHLPCYLRCAGTSQSLTGLGLGFPAGAGGRYKSRYPAQHSLDFLALVESY